MDHDPAEELAASRYASLVQTPHGYEVHRRERATIETFPANDQGFDAAWDRYSELTRVARSGRALSALVVIGVAAAVLWFVLALINGVLYVVVTGRSGSHDPIIELLSWISPFTTAAYALFVGAVGSYGAGWLYRRGMPPARRRT